MNDLCMEFVISGSASGSQSCFQVVGRCGDFPIRLGDVFDLVFRLKRPRFPDQLGDDPLRIEEHESNLKVAEIQAYGHDLQELSEGMTGSLILVGEGTEYLATGWILGRRSLVLNPLGQVHNGKSTQSIREEEVALDGHGNV